MLGRYDSLFDLLQDSSSFNLRQEWLRLTNSTRRGSDISFAEFAAVFEAIQKGFVRSPDMSPWRGSRSMLRNLLCEVKTGRGCVSRMDDRQVEKAIVEAVWHGRLVIWPGDRALVEKVWTMRACRVAATCAPARTPGRRIQGVKEKPVGDVDAREKKEKLHALVRRLGNAVAAGEGGYESYNAGTAGVRGKVLYSSVKSKAGTVTGRTINEILATKSKLPSDPARLFATGKYQTIIPTLAEAKKKLGLTGDEKYTAEMQERVFREFLIPHAGGKRVLDKFIFEGEGTINDAQYAAAKEWASIAVPSGARIGDGRTSDGTLSYYDRLGQNSANQASTKQFADVLKEIYEAR